MKPTQTLRHGLLGAAILVIAASATPLSAQAQRLSLGERVDKLEQQVNGAGGGNAVDLVNQIQALQSQVQMLQGQVEELKHQLDQNKQNAKDQYIDLDSRIGRLEGTAPAGAAPAGARPPVRNDAPPPDIELGTRND
ncbi:MAG: YbgF trimerization domain-containing protein, partial [Rhodanobacteraceae bacterium]